MITSIYIYTHDGIIPTGNTPLIKDGGSKYLSSLKKCQAWELFVLNPSLSIPVRFSSNAKARARLGFRNQSGVASVRNLAVTWNERHQSILNLFSEICEKIVLYLHWHVHCAHEYIFIFQLSIYRYQHHSCMLFVHSTVYNALSLFLFWRMCLLDVPISVYVVVRCARYQCWISMLRAWGI